MTPEQIKRSVANRDYTTIAKAFADEVARLKELMTDWPANRYDHEMDAVVRLANKLALVLKADNPSKFDKAAFLKACGIDRIPG